VARLEALEEVGAPWLFPVEFQTVPDPKMFGRLQKQVGEWWNDLRPDELPDSRYQVSAAVVNLTGTCASAPASRENRFPNPDGLFWSVKVRERYLADESADETLTRVEKGELRPSLLALIRAMHGAGDPGIISRWIASASKEPDARRADLGSLALTLAALKEWYPAWKQALKEWNVQESLYVLELQLETKLKTKLADLKVLLEERFGKLPDDLLNRIDTITDMAKVDQIFRSAVRINRLEELPL
jgi:hypothetical protein